MPHRYAGRWIPATLYAYPFDYLVAVVLVSAGLFINVYPAAAPASIADLPEVWSVVFRVMALAGGVLVTVGLVQGPHRWSFSAEMAGMILAAGVFGTYAMSLITALAAKPGGLLGAILLTGLSLACLLKAYALGIESRLRLKLLVEAGEIKRSENR